MDQTDFLRRVERVYAFWGRFPSLYRAQDRVTFLGRADTIRRRAVEALALQRGDQALEVACGSGRNFSSLEEAVGSEGEIVGLDYSREMLDAAHILCHQHGWQNIHLIQGDAARLELGPQVFDGVVSVLGISAVPDWESALRRAWERVKPGKYFVVCDARLFRGSFRFLNPVIRRVYSRFAVWDPSKDIPLKMQELFGAVEVQEFNAGTFFIARSRKPTLSA